MNFLKAMFGNYSKREVKRVQPICDKVLALEDKYAAMSESELKNQTTILKERLANGETTDDILPEAFATCREAGWRVLGMKHFPVQIIGGIVLHQGRIAEMKTGEGKTLVATLPAYLNALTGVVTQSGWASFTDTSVFRSALSATISITRAEKRLMPQTLHTEQTTNSVLTTSVTTW